MTCALYKALHEQVVGTFFELAKLLEHAIDPKSRVEVYVRMVERLIHRSWQAGFALTVVVQLVGHSEQVGSRRTRVAGVGLVFIRNHQFLCREQRDDLWSVGRDHDLLLDASCGATVAGRRECLESEQHPFFDFNRILK